MPLLSCLARLLIPRDTMQRALRPLALLEPYSEASPSCIRNAMPACPLAFSFCHSERGLTSVQPTTTLNGATKHHVKEPVPTNSSRNFLGDFKRALVHAKGAFVFTGE